MRCALNCLFYCVLNLLAYIHTVNMYPFVRLGIHFFFLFTDTRIHVYLLVYFLIYSVGFCLSGQALSLWHDHQLSGAGRLQLYLGQYRFSCGAAQSFITAPPPRPVLIVLRARHKIIGGRHQIISREWTMKRHMTTIIIGG